MRRFGDRLGAIIFGPPGAGKGTYGDLLKSDFGFERVSPGDIFRAAIKAPSTATAFLAEVIRNGKLVPDEQVAQVVLAAIEGLPPAPLLFDGFPRTAAQARALASAFDLSRFFLINVDMRRDILVEKLSGRRICANCGKGYNYCSIDRDGYYLKPLLPKDGKSCDVCNGVLVARPDDIPQVIEERLRVYDRECDSVMSVLEPHRLPAVSFDPLRGVDDYPLLRQQVKPCMDALLQNRSKLK